MATLESIKNKLQNLIDASNEVTGELKSDLTSAVSTLIDGYMKGESSSEYLRYVTFMSPDYETVSETATVEPRYSYSMSNAPKQYKDSTVDTVFSHVGWSLTPDGEVTTTALTDMKNDVTLYPVFKSSVRHYTVRFYNGNELVCTESVPYGGSSDYVHELVGAWFLGWNPVPENITGDMDCYGTWEYTAFATASWDRIAEIAKAGRCSEYYNVGDEREIIRTNGERITVQLASFDKYGSGDGITIVAKNALANSKMVFNDTPYRPYNVTTYNYYGFEGSNVYTYLNEQVFPTLPTDLQRVLSDVNIPNISNKWGVISESALPCKLFVPSDYEVYGLDMDRINGSTQIGFETFIDTYDNYGLPSHHDRANERRIVTLRSTGEPVRWWTRTPGNQIDHMNIVHEDGAVGNDGYTNEASAYVVFAFCL